MYDTFCIGGGAIKAFSFVGVLKYIIENKLIIHFKKFIGVSAGSMYSFLFIIGYNIYEIEEFILNFNFKKIFPEINVENLLFYYGLKDNTQVKTLLILFLKKKYNITDITFKQLYDKTNIHFQVGVSNFSYNQFELWDYINHPNTSVIKAITISTNIPIIFKPIKFNNQLYLDGGILNNFPIDKVLPSEYKNTICIGTSIKHVNNTDFTNIFDYIIRIFNSYSNIRDNKQINKFISQLDIIPISLDIDPINFDINKETIKNIIYKSYNIAKKFFDNKKKITITRRNSI